MSIFVIRSLCAYIVVLTVYSLFLTIFCTSKIDFCPEYASMQRTRSPFPHDHVLRRLKRKENTSKAESAEVFENLLISCYLLPQEFPKSQADERSDYEPFKLLKLTEPPESRWSVTSMDFIGRYLKPRTKIDTF